MLAVLPFENMSRDAEQEYFADGIAEDIITALSRFRSFAVASRLSSFAYKGRAMDVPSRYCPSYNAFARNMGKT